MLSDFSEHVCVRFPFSSIIGIETLNNDDDLSSIVFVKEESNTFKYRTDWISIQGRLSVLLLCVEMNVPDMKNGDDDDDDEKMS